MRLQVEWAQRATLPNSLGRVAARIAVACLCVACACGFSGVLLATDAETAYAHEGSTAQAGSYESEVEAVFGDGVLHGYAAVRKPVGGTFEGTPLSTQQLDGSGTYTWPNGDSYVGEWLEDTMDGEGVYTFANGATLSGTFEDDLFMSGTYQATVGGSSYLLRIEDGDPYWAKIKTAKGFSYTGAFSDGRPSGKGTATYRKGGRYSGKFVNGLRSGKGTYKWKNGAKYVGSWKKDRMNGKGTYYYPTKSKAKKLVGAFSRNNPKGKCTYVLRSGKKYKTTWKNGHCVKVTR